MKSCLCAPTPAHPLVQLELDEILSTLAEMDIAGVAEDDLVKGRQEVVKKIYDALLVKIMGVSKDALFMPKYDALHVLEHPELYDDATHVILFIRLMRVAQSPGPQASFELIPLCARPAAGTRCSRWPAFRMATAFATSSSLNAAASRRTCLQS